MMSRLLAGPKALWRFLVSTYHEIYRITWPGRNQTIRLTGVVVVVCVVLGAFLTGLDYLMSQGLKLLIK